MSFSEFLRRRDNDLLMEMPRVKKDQILAFNQFDDDYLRHFVQPGDDELTRLFFTQAIMYRYGPQVLQNPDPEVRNIELTVAKGGKHIRKVFPNVNVHSHELLKDLVDKKYDPMRVDTTRTAAKLAANKEMEYRAGNVDEDGRGSLSPGNARLGAATKAPTAHRQSYDDKPMTRDAVVDLTSEQDYLAAAERGGVSKIAALIWKYSNGPFNNGQPIDVKAGKGSKEYPVTGVRLGPGMFRIKSGKNEADVPLDVAAHEKLLEKYVNMGINYKTHPMSWGTAARKVAQLKEKGAAAVAPGNTTKMDVADWIVRAKFNNIEDYVQGQADHLRDDSVDSPGIPDERAAGKYFNYQTGWLNILRQEAEVAASRVIRFFQSKVQNLTNIIDEGELESDIWAFMQSDEAINNKGGHPDQTYRYQGWRMRVAEQYGRRAVKKMLSGNHRNASDMDVSPYDMQGKKDDEAGDEVNDFDAETRQKIVDGFSDLLDKMIEKAEDKYDMALSPDTDTVALAGELADKAKEYFKKHRTHPSRTRIAVWAEELLAQHMTPGSTTTKKPKRFANYAHGQDVKNGIKVAEPGSKDVTSDKAAVEPKGRDDTPSKKNEPDTDGDGLFGKTPDDVEFNQLVQGELAKNKRRGKRIYPTQSMFPDPDLVGFKQKPVPPANGYVPKYLYPHPDLLGFKQQPVPPATGPIPTSMFGEPEGHTHDVKSPKKRSSSKKVHAKSHNNNAPQKRKKDKKETPSLF